MMLASIEGAIGSAAIAALIIGFRWIREKFAEKSSDPAFHGNGAPKSSASLGARNESEEERMRRFLEALGIPSESHPVQKRETPPPLRRQERKEAPIKPIPPIIAKSGNEPFEQRVPPLPKRRQETQPKLGRPTLDQAPAPKVPAGQIQAGSLQTREVTEFQTITSNISAIPGETAAVRKLAPKGVTAEKETENGELWREALRSPEALRSAFILREILGAPKGLQSNGFPHSFPSL